MKRVFFHFLILLFLLLLILGCDIRYEISDFVKVDGSPNSKELEPTPTPVYTPPNPTPTVTDIASSVSGLVVWLKPEALSGIADGQQLSSWTDSSGNGNDAYQSTAGSQPKRADSMINGYPAVQFNGAEYLYLPEISTSHQITFYMVVRLNYNSGNDQYLYYDGGSGSEKLVLKSSFDDYACFDAIDYSNFNLYSDNSNYSLQGNFYIIHLTLGATDVQLDVNTSSGFYNQNPDFSFMDLLSGYQPVIGMNPELNNYFLYGDIAEIIIYDQALVSTDKDIIYNYLADKYLIY